MMVSAKKEHEQPLLGKSLTYGSHTKQLPSGAAEVDTKLQTESEFKIQPCLQDFLI